MNKSEPIAIPSYLTIVKREETTDGHPCYIAYHPELPDCLGQGETSTEAVESLVEATEMTVQYLLDNGLPIPMPQRDLSMTTQLGGSATLQYVTQSVRSVPSVQTQNFGVPA